MSLINLARWRRTCELCGIARHTTDRERPQVLSSRRWPGKPPSHPSVGPGARTGRCAGRPPRPCSGPHAPAPPRVKISRPASSPSVRAWSRISVARLHGVLRSLDRPHTVARVVGPELHRHGPFQNRADPLAHAPGRDRLHVPERGEDLKHIGAGHLRDRQPARFCSTTVAAASAKLGMPWAHRFWARGSPPSRASLRLARAFSRASTRETSSTLPRARRDAIFRIGTDLGKDRPVTGRSMTARIKIVHIFLLPAVGTVYDRPNQDRAYLLTSCCRDGL